MGAPGIKISVIGIAVLIAVVIFNMQFATDGSEILVYGAVAIGVALLGYGALQFLRDRNISPEQRAAKRRALADSVLLKSLSRMSGSDTNIRTIEVETIQKIYKDLTGKEVATSEVRVAAQADLYEPKPFTKFISSVQDQIDLEDKKKIVRALVIVIEADGRVSPHEVGFFNEIVKALKMDPADLIDMTGKS